MTETVTSKFRKSLWIAPILFASLVIIFLAACVMLIWGNSRRGTSLAPFAVIGLIGYISYNANHAMTRLIKVTVSPDALFLHYLLTGKRVTVNYADIIHVGLFRENNDVGGLQRWPSLVDAIKLKIELRTGKNVYLFEEYYENFDELKEAIRRARFGLD